MFTYQLWHDTGYFVVLIFCSLSVLIGCQSTPPDEQRPPYVEALSDFVFVGSGSYEPSSVPAHGMEEQSLPSQLKTGYQYIFHLPRSKQNEDIYKTLLTRLQSRGVRIISSSADIDRYVGGPEFHITFQWNGYKGTIFNKLDGQIINNEALADKWSVDDYILVLEEA